MTTRNERAWSDDEDTYLKAMWADGWSASHIGKKLKRTRNSVIGKAHRLKLPEHALAPDRGQKPPNGDRHPPAAAKRAVA